MALCGKHCKLSLISQNCSPTFKFGTDIGQFLVYPLYLSLLTFTCK